MTTPERRISNALAAVRRGLAALDAELERHRVGRGTVGDSRQLEAFRRQLEAMGQELESGAVSGRQLGMGRSIVDSWPLDSALAEVLLEAEQRYRELVT